MTLGLTCLIFQNTGRPSTGISAPAWDRSQTALRWVTRGGYERGLRICEVFNLFQLDMLSFQLENKCVHNKIVTRVTKPDNRPGKNGP